MDRRIPQGDFLRGVAGAELARAFGVSEPTVRHYLDILADSGLLHALLDIDPDRESLLGHPRVGASWEGFALHQIVRALSAHFAERDR